MHSKGLLVIALAAAPAVFAQEAPQPRMRFERFEAAVPPPPGMAGAFGDVTFEFLTGEANFEPRLVKGAPYSAETGTETNQVLSDGNRITRRNSSVVYRDSDGRTRREVTLGTIGPWAARGEARQTVFINDPAAGVNYVLDPQNRTARKMTMRNPRERQGGGGTAPAMPAGPGERVRTAAPANRPEPRIEPLGKRMIEGVEAEGSRSTLTLAAGEIGNERPIEVVTERWFSRDLQTVVMSRRSDPRMGETTFKLTNIRRTEPLRSLFEVPPDFTIQEGGPGPEMRWRQGGPPPPRQ